MAKHLDLEEQEQLDQIKHFWQQYGNSITWGLIVVLAVFAGWNGFQYWQRSQAAAASAMYDEVSRSVQAGDPARVDRAWADMQDKYGRTTFAQQAGMLVAKADADGGRTEPAKAALTWVMEKSQDEGYQAIARLRLAGVLMDGQHFDDALKALDAKVPAQFDALVADRKGDILNAQGKKAEALAEYLKAYQGLEPQNDYRHMVEVKLNALGGEPPIVTVTKASEVSK